MNATFVLMTAAWLSGQHAAPAPIPAPAHGHGHGAIAAPGYQGCGADCWGGCEVQCEREGCLQRLLGRLRARRNSNDCCATDCGCGHGHASYVSTGSCHGGSCGASNCYTASNDCCCETRRHGFGHRMRGLFRRNQCCDYSADYGCGCQGGYGQGHIAPAPAYGAAGYGAPGVIPGAPGALPGGVTPDATMPKAGEGAGAEQMPAPQPAPQPAPAPAPKAAPAPAGTGLTEPPVTNDIGIDNPVSGPIPLNEPSLNIVPPAVPAVPSNGSPVAPF